MLRKPVAILALPIVAAALVAFTLSGCAPAAVKHHASAGSNPNSPQTTVSPSTPGSAAPSATPTATPTPTGPAPLPANALFRISATVTAPGGAIADLVQTVYLPTVPTAAQKTQLNHDCAGQFDTGATGAPWLNNYATAAMLTSTMTATLRPGSPAWNNSSNPVYADFVGFGDFTGAYGLFEAYCSPGTIKIPGTQNALSPIQKTNPSGQNYGWAGEFASYGFFGGANDPGPDSSGKAVVAHCVVQLSATAAAVPTAAAWVTEAQTLSHACDYRGAQ